MALGKGLKGFRLFAIGLLVAAPSASYAHSLLVNPVPRDTTDTKLKMANCGGDATNGPLLKGQPVAQYEAGASVPITWKETIAHGGCYQLRLNATGNDTNESDFTILTQIDDPPNGTGTRNATVKLPDGVTCANCTLQLLQIMRTDSGACAPDAAPMAITNVQTLYYSCADVRIGDFADAGALKDAGPPDEDAASQDEPGSSGSTTTPTDGGGKTSSSSSGDGNTGSRSLRQSDDGGCSVANGTTSGISFFLSAGIAVMALSRRRKNDKKS